MFADQMLIRICLIIGSLLAAIFVLRRVRQAKVQIEDTIYWLCFSAVLLVLAFFPGIAYWASHLLGFQSPINFVYVVIIFLLLARQFFLSIRISQMDSRLRILTEQVALNQEKQEMAKISNRDKKKGSLADVIKGADVFIGVSAPGTVTEEMVKSMAENPILFTMANPVPEIMPEDAKRAGAAVVGTGRSDFPNQINNVLAFPGIFRGALDVRAKDINDEMKIAAAYAIAGLIEEKDLTPDYIIPNPFDKRVVEAVSKAVADAARKTGVARI